VFSPRYRGSWESEGYFLARSPHLDVIDVINSLSSGFIDLWNNKKYKIKNPQIYLIGSSFGGPAVILASKDKRVKKAIAFSPVIDWKIESKLEPIDWLRKFTKIAFSNGYRFKQKDWDKLKKGKFYNPITEIKKLDKNKICIIHAKDDEVVYADTSIKFAKQLGCKITLLKKGGHLSTSNLIKTRFWNRINNFIKRGKKS
jgi:alpha-beta hydrolase superfamily lysophospholipase